MLENNPQYRTPTALSAHFEHDANLARPVDITETQTPWSATPLGLTTDTHMNKGAQDTFYDVDLPQRAKEYLSDETPLEIVRLCFDSLDAVRHRRGILNAASYAQRDPTRPTDETIREIEQAAFESLATPLGLFKLIPGLHIPSIELVKVTFSGHLWPAMRTDVRNSMEAFDEDMEWVDSTLDKPIKMGRVAHDENSGDLSGFIVRARKMRGHTGKLLVREVVSALVRIDERSGFEQNAANTLRQNYDSEYSLEQFLKNERTKPIIRELQHHVADDTEPFPSWAIPLTSTSYAFDPDWQHHEPPEEQPVLTTLEEHRLFLQAEEERRKALRCLPSGGGGWVQRSNW